MFVGLFPLARMSTRDRLNAFRDFQKEINIYDCILRTRSVGASMYHLLLPTMHIDRVTQVLTTHDIKILHDVNLEEPCEYDIAKAKMSHNYNELEHEKFHASYQERLVDLAARYLNGIPPKLISLRKAFLNCFPTLFSRIIFDAEGWEDNPYDFPSSYAVLKDFIPTSANKTSHSNATSSPPPPAAGTQGTDVQTMIDNDDE
jgi:hypothetical protein